MLKDFNVNGASLKWVEYRPAGIQEWRKYPWRVKFVFLFNEDGFPSIDTTDEAFIEQLMLIPHRSKFVSELPDMEDPDLNPKDKEHIHLRDPDIMMKIQGPWRPYILQWCLEGLCRYFAEKVTKRPASSKEWLGDITMAQDDVRELVATHWMHTGNQKSYIKQGDVWARYRDHCSINSIANCKRMNQTQFYKHLRRVMKGYREHVRVEGVQFHKVFLGWEEK
ncbi:hypothetical protein HK102_002146 [Quaeritorhiza haematococci]|nr:hypothetical protein HK102_002146 [Quaeritorhiza haematococci]